jgi:hypothetical protein
MIQKFISDTYSMVTQLHLELVTLTNVLLERGIITTKELDEKFEVIKQQHDSAVAAAHMEEQGLTDQPDAQNEVDEDNGFELVPIDGQEENDGSVDIGSKPTIGRKPPKQHGETSDE